MKTDQSPILVWFRNDLRLADNPALGAAAEDGAPVIPVYIREKDAHDPWLPGGASRWWLHGSLERLGKALAKLGSPLVLRSGDPAAGPAGPAEGNGADTGPCNRPARPHAPAPEPPGGDGPGAPGGTGGP
ncbi:deoxyribodipyrimidine photo-lyase, partial [Azospirillum brasilense]|nr:deoxyribodipyrimidine photo-lyase [Azospirillum brasilense]